MVSRSAGTSGQLRIIGGRWRSRKLRFRATPGLRPTPDRVRETLFNWLGGALPGARCLDLFAGSGALGLEALSRGAAYCRFLESHGGSAKTIRAHLATLDCDDADCIQDDALRYVAAANRDAPFDLAFLDPPFGEHLLAPACAALDSNGWLATAALIYLESSVHEPRPELPPGWRLHRDKSAGDVRFQLFVRGP